MAVSRSPNYPQMDLGSALEAIRPAYKAEGRNKMSRLTLAEHLGYSSLNGRALAKIGAVRAYGLIDGREDAIRIAQDAIIALEAPEGSPERGQALARSSLKPPIFKEIAGECEGLPSESNLRFSLIKKGYAPDAAGTAAQNYLATMRLVGELETGYSDPTADEVPASDAQSVEFDMALPARIPGTIAREAQPPSVMREGEREWLRGDLSREVSYRLFIQGEIGPKEIGKLIKLLQAQKDVLDDDDDYGGL
ncbi:hypothetical protein [Brevundimonas sp.]